MERGNRKERREKEKKKEERGKGKMIYLCGENRRKKKENEGCFVFGSDSMFFLCVDLWWFYVAL